MRSPADRAVGYPRPQMAAAAETKVWMTPKRIERGPEAADEELRRWAKSAFRPVKIYGNPRAMREDALASRSAGVGSKLIAREPRKVEVGDLYLAIAGLLALGGGFLVGRWWARRRRVEAAAGSSYVRGVDALGGF